MTQDNLYESVELQGQRNRYERLKRINVLMGSLTAFVAVVAIAVVAYLLVSVGLTVTLQFMLMMPMLPGALILAPILMKVAWDSWHANDRKLQAVRR